MRNTELEKGEFKPECLCSGLSGISMKEQWNGVLAHWKL